jgi:4-hydroxyproline epimerase
VRFIDSHTEGEPTRVIIEGGPDLGSGSMQERIERFAQEFDHVRRAINLEPRGSEALVGALLVEPTRDDCVAGILFFNNTGYLGMCGHGTIGTAVTLAYMGKIGPGVSNFETPASYRYRSDVTVDVPDYGAVTGDIAWGGNWFFLARDTPCPINLGNERALTDAALKVQQALRDQDITGRDGGEIDHIEFFSAAQSEEANSRNFVLCPGGAYDRSPCGTGTSAKIACLADAGVLAPDTDWIQESVIGSRFIARYSLNDQGEIIPSITGRAFICSEGTLVQQPGDPFAAGIR